MEKETGAVVIEGVTYEKIHTRVELDQWLSLRGLTELYRSMFGETPEYQYWTVEEVNSSLYDIVDKGHLIVAYITKVKYLMLHEIISAPAKTQPLSVLFFIIFFLILHFFLFRKEKTHKQLVSLVQCHLCAHVLLVEKRLTNLMNRIRGQSH